MAAQQLCVSGIMSYILFYGYSLVSGSECSSCSSACNICQSNCSLNMCYVSSLQVSFHEIFKVSYHNFNQFVLT